MNIVLSREIVNLNRVFYLAAILKMTCLTSFYGRSRCYNSAVLFL